MTPEAKEFMEHWPQLSKEFAAGMPGLFKPTFLGAAIGAGLGYIFARNPVKGGIIGGGIAFVSGLIAETAFSFGAGAGASVAIQQCMGLKPGQRLSWDQMHVGAPGQDYSFTRRPGYNDKNY